MGFRFSILPVTSEHFLVWEWLKDLSFSSFFRVVGGPHPRFWLHDAGGVRVRLCCFIATQKKCVVLYISRSLRGLFSGVPKNMFCWYFVKQHTCHLRAWSRAGVWHEHATYLMPAGAQPASSTVRTQHSDSQEGEKGYISSDLVKNTSSFFVLLFLLF